MIKKLILPVLFIFPMLSHASDTFNLSTGELQIPSVLIGASCFKATLQHQGDLVFNVTTAEPIEANVTSNMVTVEPDDFSENSIITTQSSISLSIVGSDNLDSTVLSFTAPGQSFTGTQIFGYNTEISGETHARWYTPERNLRIDFTTPTNSVSAGVTGFDNFDGAIMEIYDSAGILLDTISTDITTDPGETVSTGVRTIADISYAIITGRSQQDGIGIDNLQYNEITVTCGK
jgi:hypothetical protein